MADTTIDQGSLVLYRTRPALVQLADDKLEIVLEDGKTLRVRPKDVAPLHPGPIESFLDLETPAGEMVEAWELLAGDATTLAELAELAYGSYTPATAWAAWEWVADGLYFHGTPDAIEARAPEDVSRERALREARVAEAEAKQAFIARVQQGQFAPEDLRYLQEVEDLALGRRDNSRVLAELARAQTPESAHGLLLEIGYWDIQVDPYPQRLDVSTALPVVVLSRLPDEPRVDLTGLPAFAIDDEGSDDPDDAVSLDGERLWVHVADVAAIVPPDSPADLEARGRGANLYLPEGTITMLPPQATAQLGMGLADVSPALSIGMWLDDHGDIADTEIVRSWVRVTRLTYEEADERLGEAPFAALDLLARRCENRRRDNGAMFIDLPEVKIWVEDGQVRIRPLEPLRSRALVSEAMLMAGEAAARFALAREISVPYTTQDQPPAEEFPDTLSGMFARRKTLKSSQQSTIPGPHAGLGLDIYARATSPLRRYPDLVVHQQLWSYLRGEPQLDSQAILERVGAAEAVSGNVRRAERLARRHWTLVYLLQTPDWRGQGVLVEKTGLRGAIVIPDLGWETRVHLRDDLPLDSVVSLRLAEVNLPALDAYFRVEP